MSGRDGNALTVSRQWVTSGIFDVLGVKPIAGRTFSPEDEAQRRRGVVISEGLWETRFDRDPSIVGGELKLDGELWTVVGVMPTGLRDPRPHLDVGDASVSTQHAAARAWRLPAAGRGPDEAGCRRRGGAGRPGSGGRGPGARVSRLQQGADGDRRAAARHDGRQRSQDHLDAVPRRGRLRAADLLRERRQPAAGAGDRAGARAGGPLGARRRPPPHHPAAAHRERRAVDHRRRARHRRRRRDSAGGAGADSRGPAARHRHARVRHARRRVLRDRRR